MYEAWKDVFAVIGYVVVFLVIIAVAGFTTTWIEDKVKRR